LGQRIFECVFLIGTRSAQSIMASGFTAAQTGRTHDRTRPMLQQRQKVLAKAPSTHKINFGTGGVGTTPHITAELFEHDAGIRMVHVAYRGEAPAINDTVAGQVPLMFANLSAVMGHLKGGTLRGIAVTSAHRARTAPDIPTVAETIPGFAAETWFGIVAPTGTARDILERLNAAARQALASADTKARLAELGMSNGSSSPEEFDAYIKSEITKWGRVIEDAHIEAAN
jgi:tripartite-type tricarboxylate transporter receptor subunit TctC